MARAEYGGHNAIVNMDQNFEGMSLVESMWCEDSKQKRAPSLY